MQHLTGIHWWWFQASNPQNLHLHVAYSQKKYGSGPRGATAPIDLKFGIQPPTILYFDHTKFQALPQTFFSPSKLHLVPAYTIVRA